MCFAKLRCCVVRSGRRRGPAKTVLAVGDLEPAVQAGLRDPEILRDLAQRCFALAGYGDDIGSELGGKRLRHEIDPSSKDESSQVRSQPIWGQSQTYGYIIDYRDLFKSLNRAYTDYTSEAFEGYEKNDIEGLLEDRIEMAREDLDEALEIIRALAEPVAPPKGTLEYQHYFVSYVPGDAEQIKANEPKRIALYKGVASLARTYAALANDMDRAGYSAAEATAIKDELAHYVAARDEVELGAGENIDLKQFEAGMRALLDTYIQADPVETVATFEKGLVELIVERGAGAIEALPPGIRMNPAAAAETIVNNVRKTIIDEHAMNPKYYDKMSELLDALIEQRRQHAIDYKQYLAQVLELATTVGTKESDANYPDWVDTVAQRALIDFGWPPGANVQIVYETIQGEKRHNWTGDKFKQRELANAIRRVLPEDFEADRVPALINLLKEHDEYR